MEPVFKLEEEKRDLPLHRPILSTSVHTNTQKKHLRKMFHYRTGFVRNTSAVKNRLTAQRNYGFIKATNRGTPFPKAAEPIDTDMLSARLAAAEQLGPYLGIEHLKSSHSEDEEGVVGSVPEKRSVIQLHDGNLPRLSATSFHERRRLFDLAEFTICKGRKLSDNFHQPIINIGTMNKNHCDLNSLGNYSSFTSSKHFKEVEAFCLARHIQLSEGFGFGMAKKFY